MSEFNRYIDRQTAIAQAQADIYLVQFIDDCIYSIVVGYKKTEDGPNNENLLYLHAKKAIIFGKHGAARNRRNSGSRRNPRRQHDQHHV